MSDDKLALAIDIYRSCVSRLAESVSTPPEDERDLAGIIKHFELAFEQSHKCLVELLFASGEEDPSRTVKNVFRRAFELGTNP